MMPLGWRNPHQTDCFRLSAVLRLGVVYSRVSGGLVHVVDPFAVCIKFARSGDLLPPLIGFVPSPGQDSGLSKCSTGTSFIAA